MAANEPLSLKTITDAIDAVEASVQGAAAGNDAEAKSRDEALVFLQDIRAKVKAFCASRGNDKGPEFIPYRAR